MLRIGRLRIEGTGKRPVSREAFKADIKAFASHLGLQLRFVTRKDPERTYSYCDVHGRVAVICEGVDDRLYPLYWVIELALHEIAHWIQFNEGMFKDYFGESYYGGIRTDTADRRLALRAERHADFLANRMLKEMYGMEPRFPSIYEDAEGAREFLHKHYGG